MNSPSLFPESSDPLSREQLPSVLEKLPQSVRLSIKRSRRIEYERPSPSRKPGQRDRDMKGEKPRFFSNRENSIIRIIGTLQVKLTILFDDPPLQEPAPLITGKTPWN